MINVDQKVETPLNFDRKQSLVALMTNFEGLILIAEIPSTGAVHKLLKAIGEGSRGALYHFAFSCKRIGI